MNKIFSLISFILLAMTSGLIQAQTKAAVKKTDTSKVVHTKKNGTADKRFKENKTSTTVAGPLKKDGTPDMRYKANKKTAASTKKAVQ